MLYRCGGHDGHASWHETLATSFQRSDGERRTLLVCREVSRRQSELAHLKESEERYRLLVEQAPEGIIVHSRGVILFANNAAATTIGAPDPASLVGTKVQEIVAPESREETRRQVEEARRGRVMSRRAWRLLRRDGAVRDMEGTGGLATWDGRKAILGIMRDVTDLRGTAEADPEAGQPGRHGGGHRTRLQQPVDGDPGQRAPGRRERARRPGAGRDSR
jgi:PAS domain S-box-containing protein